MKIALGMYTTLSFSVPSAAYKRALSLIYQPVLKYVYDREDVRFSLYQSSAMMNFFSEEHSEVNFLISTLVKRGSLRLFTGMANQSIMSLYTPRERANEIEKMTTMIRKLYSYKAQSAFFYGEVWSPQVVSTLSSLSIANVVISTYSQRDKKELFNQVKVMSELGKKVRICPFDDNISRIISSFAQGETTLEETKERIREYFCTLSPDAEVFIFLYIDQLLEAYNRRAFPDLEDDISSVFLTIFEEADKRGAEYSFVENFSQKGKCYLDSGWYGRDAYSGNLSSFCDIFVRNSMCRYVLNRVLTLNEILQMNKKDRDIKKISENDLPTMLTGPLFIYDPQCGPLRSSERMAFWKKLIAAEKTLYSKTDFQVHSTNDYEEAGYTNYTGRSENYSLVFSPLGGSVVELDLLKKEMNIVDSKSHFDKSFLPFSIKHSFADTIRFSSKVFKTKYFAFDANVLNRQKTDFEFILERDDFPFSLVKHYKIRSQTITMESTIIAKQDMEDALYQVNFYLSLDDFSLAQIDQKMLMMLGSLDNVRSFRIQSSSYGFEILFTSTQSFSISQDVKKQSQYTVLGLETFNLYSKFTFSFPYSIKKGESETFRLIFRSQDLKNKE